jgi:hypothetical protein
VCLQIKNKKNQILTRKKRKSPRKKVVVVRKIVAMMMNTMLIRIRAMYLTILDVQRTRHPCTKSVLILMQFKSQKYLWCSSQKTM